ncbi:MAG TPA: hypothetical protein H9867_00730 [Candidatus Corynebacterium gallistercoris]|uniref:Uncharacterized protein n=1 Tax=Candidatus Corynebacterium gallistercoris TaxID=2838530 RepID=A0A9D1RWI7_9CORY|nr:hypothetical protein [Candidatus Corynebacterium gallistercoris]
MTTPQEEPGKLNVQAAVTRCNKAELAVAVISQRLWELVDRQAKKLADRLEGGRADATQPVNRIHVHVFRLEQAPGFIPDVGVISRQKQTRWSTTSQI